MGNAITESRDYQSSTIDVTGQLNPVDASALCSIADASEVVKLSAAIQALRRS